MNYGFHLATTGAITGMRRLDTVANNLANANTVGFKSDMLALAARRPENLEHAGEYADTNATLDALGGGSLFHPNAIDLRQGTIRATGNPLDVAIRGEGFLMLEQTGGGKDALLTRCGTLTQDPRGRLVLSTTGAAVLDTKGRTVSVDPNGASVRIDADGRVYQGDDEVARLAVVVPDDLRNLAKEGRDALRLSGGRTRSAPESTTIEPAAVEESVVDPISTLAELVRVSRGIEFSTRLMQYHDQLTGRLVQTLGRFG